MKVRTFTLLLALAVTLAGCASESAVGSDSLLDVDETDAGERLGALDAGDEPSPQPSVQPSVAPPPSPEPTPTAEPSPEPTQTAPEQPQYEPVTVTVGDSGFDPVHVRVWSGTEVRFVNETAQERSFTGLDDGWTSGPVAPGGVASYVTSAAGEFNVQDDTRVYYVVRIEVLEP